MREKKHFKIDYLLHREKIEIVGKLYFFLVNCIFNQPDDDLR